MERNLLLGIDPSLTNMGVALYDPKKRRFKLHTGDIQNAINWIGKNVPLEKVCAVIEDPNQDSPVFGSWGIFKKSLGQPISQIQKAFSREMMKAQRIGKVKAAADVIIPMLRDRGIPLILIAPSKRNKAFKELKKPNGKGKFKMVKIYKNVHTLKMPTKTSKEQFVDLTGHSMNLTEHAQDAATMIWDRNSKWFWVQYEIQMKKA